jgi:hypothetical protein
LRRRIGIATVAFFGVFVGSQKGIVAVDLRTQKQSVLPVQPPAHTELSSQWKSPSVVYALRTSEDAFEILELDARAILATQHAGDPSNAD